MKWYKCCYCENIKPEIEFYKDNSKPSGRKPRCKVCEKLYVDRRLRREYEKEYRLKNPDKRRKIMSKYYINNKKKHHAWQAIYRKTDEFKINHKKHGAIRRARYLKAFCEDVDYEVIYNKAGGVCFYCGIPILFTKAEFDHYIPLSKGGKHAIDNIRCSCQFCNRSKGAKLPDELEVCHQVV